MDKIQFFGLSSGEGDVLKNFKILKIKKIAHQARSHGVGMEIALKEAR
ncbi:MAG: hypothetical protein ACE5LV_04680 [Candidatus Aminicenantales bacterium]